MGLSGSEERLSTFVVVEEGEFRARFLPDSRRVLLELEEGE
jgi:hypothetical protein